MRFPESFVEEVAERNDIVDVVSGYVALGKRSGVNYFGLCPFHSEKTPSFAVNPETRTYHCFGCGKGGGVIGFIMEMENYSFPEAVEFLAKRAGMRLPEEDRDENRGRRTRLLELNRAAARFFYSCLTGPGGAAARAYVDRRGIAPMVRHFGLGYAPDSWDALTNAMLSRGYTREELVAASLAANGKKGGVYDFFRDRLIFPVIDVRGNVLGFSGRVLSDKEPKYLNSRDTQVYSKAKTLFALNLARKSKSGYLLLVEGNVDVVSLHQAGFDSAVASLGTALTGDQARLMSRYTGEIVIAYDSDEAGRKAARRAIGVLAPLDLRVRVLQIPGAKDPDEFIRARGPGAFRELIERSGNQTEYLLARLEDEHSLETDEGRSEYLRAAAGLIASLPSGADREIYGLRAAERAGVSWEAFRPEVDRARGKKTAAARRQEESEATAPLRAAQPRDRRLRYENVRSARAEEGLIGIAYRWPERFTDFPLTGRDFSSETLGRIFDTLLARAREGRSVSLAVLGGEFDPAEMDLLAGILQKNDLPPAAVSGAMTDYINVIRQAREREARQEDPLAYAEFMRQKKGYGSAE